MQASHSDTPVRPVCPDSFPKVPVLHQAVFLSESAHEPPDAHNARPDPTDTYPAGDSVPEFDTDL